MPESGKPYWTNGRVDLWLADARRLPLPDESVHCVVTSPPYFGLRDYGLGEWAGGDGECDHAIHRTLVSTSTLDGRPTNENHSKESWPGGICGHCGAVRTESGIGMESCLEEYVAALVGAFREIWRVLRPDGTVWLNLGDSYAGSGQGWVKPSKQGSSLYWADSWGWAKDGLYRRPPNYMTSRDDSSGLKPKDLMLVPARVAIALQEDGWVVRQRITWPKPNTMPESVRDRPTSATEDIYLLAKSNRPTFWTHREQDGTRERPEPDYRWRDALTGAEYDLEPPDWSEEQLECPDCGGSGEIELLGGQVSMFDGVPALTVSCARCNYPGAETPGQIRRWKRVNLWREWDYFYDVDAVRTAYAPWHGQEFKPRAPERKEPPAGARYGHRDKQLGHGRRHEGFNDRWDGMTKQQQQAMGANLRNWWPMATQPYRGAHFATFPEDLARTCILAGTSEHGVCADCGAPWVRVVEWTGHINKREPAHVPFNTPTKTDSTGWRPTSRATDIWRSTCCCNADVVPATVLDPFVGSGTTCVVAEALGRRAAGVDLNPGYLDLAIGRIEAGTRR